MVDTASGQYRVKIYYCYYANKLERIQQSFAALCFNRFFPQV
jgi:hypothetical protein